MTDTELLTRFVGEQDRAALTQLVFRYERLVWSVCHRMLRNREDVEDAFQTTFLTLAKKANRIRKRESLSHWLYGVARRTSMNIRKRRAVSFFSDVDYDPNQVADHSRSELDEITRQHEIDLVDQRINAMPDKFRTPLVLRYYAGLTAKQIADQMNLTVAAVEGRLRRAKQELQRSMCYESSTDAGNRMPSLAPLAALPVVSKCLSQPDLVSATAELCVATCGGLNVGTASATLSPGVKIMICKLACIAGISGLLTLGGLFHTGTFQQTNTANNLNLSAPQLAVSDAGEFSVATESQACCDDSCCDICDDGCCSICQTVHSHLANAHSVFAVHVGELCELFGLCGDDCCDGGCGSCCSQ